MQDYNEYFADFSLGWSRTWEACTEVKANGQVDVKKLAGRVHKLVASYVFFYSCPLLFPGLSGEQF